MSLSLSTGVSGLNAHQRMLDVIGNNLANVNTLGYKSRRTLFADLMYQTARSGSAPNPPNLGGINPMQIGTGVQTAQIDRLLTQGELNPTGQEFDFALDGDGYFVVQNSQGTMYTRAGAFGVDADGRLVDPGTGFEVQRQGVVGESSGTLPAFQTSGDSGINIPLGANIPGTETTLVDVTGNLSAAATGPLAHELTTATPLLAGGAAATAATLLNSLDSSIASYIVGDNVEVVGVDVAGNPVSTTVPVDGTTTLGDLVTAVSGAYPDATASLDASGNLILQADNPGVTSMVLNLVDAAGNTGGVDFANHLLGVTQTGKEGDTFTSTVEIYDSLGTAHSLTMTFEKQLDGSWNLASDLTDGSGTMLDGIVEDIRFNADGSLQQIAGIGLGDANLSIQFTGIASPQTIQLNLGDYNSFTGVSQVASPSNLSSSQDGYAPGTISSITVNSSGELEAAATNGVRIPIAQLAIASFRNPKGLLAEGDNYFRDSGSSGPPEIGSGGTGSRGAVVGRQLEGSNVDIANEFTQMIIAQRGFSANARTITVADEVLEEVTNIIR